MLNLRQIDENSRSTLSDGYDIDHRSTMRFNTSAIIGNIGESLEFGTQSDDNNDLENEQAEDVALHSGSKVPSSVHSHGHVTIMEVSECNLKRYVLT
jgi:hypothetical protein